MVKTKILTTQCWQEILHKEVCIFKNGLTYLQSKTVTKLQSDAFLKKEFG